MIITPNSQPYEGRTCMLAPNHHVIQAVISAVQYEVASTTSGCESNETDHPITESYSHASMVVLQINAFIYEITRIKFSVNPFSSEQGIADNVPILDGEIAYNFRYIHQTYT